MTEYSNTQQQREIQITEQMIADLQTESSGDEDFELIAESTEGTSRVHPQTLVYYRTHLIVRNRRRAH